MNIELLRDYCLAKKGVSESFPFDEVTLVFKVLDKVFLITGLEKIPFAFNVKCNPDKAIELREAHESVVSPGFHMNKKHWNTITPSNSLPDTFYFEMIDHSYELIVAAMPKKKRALIGK